MEGVARLVGGDRRAELWCQLARSLQLGVGERHLRRVPADFAELDHDPGRVLVVEEGAPARADTPGEHDAVWRVAGEHGTPGHLGTVPASFEKPAPGASLDQDLHGIVQESMLRRQPLPRALYVHGEGGGPVRSQGDLPPDVGGVLSIYWCHTTTICHQDGAVTMGEMRVPADLPPPSTRRRQLTVEAALGLLTIADRLRQQWAAHATALGLSTAQVNVLLLLAPGEAIPMRELASRLDYDASNLSSLVDRLERRGAVERRADTSDRRVKALTLTGSGAELRATFWRGVVEDPGPLAALSKAELESLVTTLAHAHL